MLPMDEFEAIIARTLLRLRELEASSRELANALTDASARRQELLRTADRAAEAIQDVAAMYRRAMGD